MHLQEITITNAQLLELVKLGGHLLVAIALYIRMRRELTPRWVLSLVESEKVASARLLMGSIIGVFNLYMMAAGRLEPEIIRLNWEVVFGLFLVGKAGQAASKIGEAMASRPAAPTTNIIDADKVTAAAAGNNNIKTETTQTTAASELPEGVKA